MNTRRIAIRRSEEGVIEGDPQGKLGPQGVQVPQDAQVPPKVIKSLFKVKVMMSIGSPKHD